MSRVKRGKMHLKRRRRLLKLAKGYRWGRKSKIKLAKTAVVKAGVYAYCSRRLKKRDFRQLWQVRLNAAVRPLGMTYSQFIHLLKVKNIILDRKILADLAVSQPAIFENLIKQIKI